jgi:VWFA-related protein
VIEAGPMNCRRDKHTGLTFLLLLSLAILPGIRAQEARPSEVIDSGVEERVQVVLAEFKLLVTDKKGHPVTDLRPNEIRVFEGGDLQELAFLESWLATEADRDLATREAVAAPVYAPDGTEHRTESAVVPPPKPVRRVIFVFDIRNSRLRIREEWREAALEWTRTKMGPDDVASVIVLHSYPQWVLQSTSDRASLVQALQGMDLFSDTPDRNRREEMSALLTDLEACVDIGGGSRRGSGSSGAASTTGLNDETTCAYRISQPYIDQWGNESDESILALRQLTGQLAAIPGRKAVLLFSEGIIPDPSHVAINAMLSIWGAQVINYRQISSTLRRDAFNAIGALHRVAAASDVVYFTMDTRSAAERGYSSDVERQVSQARGALGINPWNEMYEATRSTLSALAYATGGRPFYGREKLQQQVSAAAASYYGVYNVGYYRADPTNPGKLKIKIDRKGTRFELPKQVDFRRHEARPTPVELAVGRPAYSGSADRQQLPVAVMTLYDLLPLRRGAGARGCQLGIFVQAQRPDGSVSAERFDTAIVVVEKEQLDRLEGQYYDHQTTLELAPGPYRLRARVSDDLNEVMGDTFIDLTVGEGTITPGFPSMSPSESQSKETGESADD